MSARIPRLPPSRIPQEFRVIESRLSRFSIPRIRKSSRQSFWSINLPHYRIRETFFELALCLLLAAFHSFSLSDLPVFLFLFELTKRKAVPFLSRFHRAFNIWRIIFNCRIKFTQAICNLSYIDGTNEEKKFRIQFLTFVIIDPI